MKKIIFIFIIHSLWAQPPEWDFNPADYEHIMSVTAVIISEEASYGDILAAFNKQDEWTKGDVSEVVKKLERIGKISGLSGAEIQSCMQNNDKARALVESYKKNAVKDNVQSTPSFVVNGKLYSNMDYNELAEIIENNLN